MKTRLLWTRIGSASGSSSHSASRRRVRRNAIIGDPVSGVGSVGRQRDRETERQGDRGTGGQGDGEIGDKESRESMARVLLVIFVSSSSCPLASLSPSLSVSPSLRLSVSLSPGPVPRPHLPGLFSE